MKIRRLIDELGFKTFTPEGNFEKEITGIYSCDLLSWVMANGKQDHAWVTVQTHNNILAVASLLEFSCIILPDNLKPEPGVVEKAQSEGLVILGTEMGSFELFKVLYEAGLK